MNRVLLAAAAAALLSGPFAASAQEVTSTTAVVTNAQGQPVAAANVLASQPVANPPPTTTDNNRSMADTGYTGPAAGPQFYDVEAKIDAAMAKMQGNKRAEAQLRAIKAEAKVRRARHGGELRDWDREFLDKKLQQVTGAA